MNSIIKAYVTLGSRGIRSSLNNSRYIVGSTNTTTLFNIKQQQKEQINNYATISKKKLQQIREKRDEEARLAKEIKEKTFIEVNKVSITELTFEDALLNVREKLNKYHTVKNRLVATLFLKTQTVEQLHESLKLYKDLNNSNPEFFNADHIQLIYYSFVRTNQMPLFAEILINSDIFQIFPKQNVIIKVLTQLLKVDQDYELAANLLLSYQNKRSGSLNENFMKDLVQEMSKQGATDKLYKLLQLYPRKDFPLGANAIKYLLRDSIAQGTTTETLNLIAQYPTTTLDKRSNASVAASKIISNPTAAKSEYANLADKSLLEFAQDDIIINYKKATDPQVQQSIKDASKEFFNPLPSKLQFE